MLTQEELDRDYVDAPEAARLLNIGNARIRQLCLEGRFEGALKTGKSWLIPRTAVKNHTRLPSGPKPKTAKRADDAALIEAALKEARVGAKEQPEKGEDA